MKFLLILLSTLPLFGAQQGAVTAKAAAPIDLTGYWVSLVTDNWRVRVMTPPKGYYDYLPINAEGRRVADTWDPAKDEAAGNQCKGYGAGEIMRLPTRVHITWQDDNTLKLETDTGQQTRIFHFGTAAKPTGEPTWQGFSLAAWQSSGAQGGRGRGAQTGTLKVTTTNLKPGYIQKNGVPYSASSVQTEYFNSVEDHGMRYLIVTSSLEDPQYLTQSFVRSAQFKFQPDATGWNPTPCSAR